MLTVVNFVLIVVSKYLTTGEECLTIFLLQKSPVFAKISIRWSNNKTIAKVKMLKTVMFNLFFEPILINALEITYGNAAESSPYFYQWEKLTKFISEKKYLLNLTITKYSFINSKRDFDVTIF